MAKKKRKRLVQGKDWHGWAYRSNYLKGFIYWAEPRKPTKSPDHEPDGKWVRVKFVEVRCKP